MSYSNGVVAAPIGVDTDVPQVLGVGSNDVGYLCSNAHGKTNMWSRNKPVINNKIGEITQSDRKIANFGLDLQFAQSANIQTLFGYASNGIGWTYNPPTGGDYAPFRITDFEGYNHKSESMFMYDSVPTSVNTDGDAATVTIRFKHNPNADLQPQDFDYFQSMGGVTGFHYAIAFYQNINTIYFAHGPALSATTDILINVKFPSLGTWTCLFIATTEQESISNGGESIYFPNGMFTIKVIRYDKYAQVQVTNDYSTLYMDNLGIYGFNNTRLKVFASENFPSTKGEFYLEIRCYANDGSLIKKFEVDDPSNSQFTYSGTADAYFNLDFLNGNNIEFDYWAAGTNMSNLKWAKVTACVKKVSGNGYFTMQGVYEWTVYKS